MPNMTYVNLDMNISDYININLKFLRFAWLDVDKFVLALGLTRLLISLQGGSVIRMFHKELEAYIVAEGLFDDDITEDGRYQRQYSFFC